MKEPDWANFGYSVNGYEGECNNCGTVARLEFGEDEKKLLTFKCKDMLESKQTELAEFVFHFVLIKLRRECDCERLK